MDELTSNIIALTWTPHRRFKGLCDYLRVPLHEITCESGTWSRYWEQLSRTLGLLRQLKPDVLLVQNPSLILTAFAVTYCSLTQIKVVVDAHNEAVQPYVHDNWLIRWVASALLKHADLTIVTNKWLAELVERSGGRAFILYDRIPEPDLGSKNRIYGGASKKITVINSGAPDEPLGEILKAVTAMSRNDLHFCVTGSVPSDQQESWPDLLSNVEFTGFLPDNEYWALLAESLIIIDLTSMGDCLVCGAYEGLAVGRPLILSDDRAARDLFSAGAVFTKNRAEPIREALTYALQHNDEIKRDAESHAKLLQEKWIDLASQLVLELQS